MVPMRRAAPPRSCTRRRRARPASSVHVSLQQGWRTKSMIRKTIRRMRKTEKSHEDRDEEQGDKEGLRRSLLWGGAGRLGQDRTRKEFSRRTAACAVSEDELPPLLSMNLARSCSNDHCADLVIALTSLRLVRNEPQAHTTALANEPATAPRSRRAASGSNPTGSDIEGSTSTAATKGDCTDSLAKQPA
eukprot:GHVU01012759.1.p1 GENE.GHVU01012759.1~~GHVU01012759.1.p1  ORF type:complete len:189 (-),score=14.38 GHVU01012759.1:142-708(-)